MYVVTLSVPLHAGSFKYQVIINSSPLINQREVIQHQIELNIRSDGASVPIQVLLVDITRGRT